MALTRPLLLLLTLPIVRSASLEECTTNCQPTTDAMAQCNQRCFDQGHCCTGTVSGCQAPSCAMGCVLADEIRARTADVGAALSACVANCTAAQGQCEGSVV